MNNFEKRMLDEIFEDSEHKRLKNQVKQLEEEVELIMDSLRALYFPDHTDEEIFEKLGDALYEKITGKNINEEIK